MIVVDDPQEPQSPGERSPLKSPTVTTQEGLPSSQPAPPPYAATAVTSYERSQPYHSIAPRAPHLAPPVTVVVIRRNSALRRFLRALGVTLIIVFLWGMFVDSIDLAVWHGRRGRHLNEADKTPGGFEWVIRDWYKKGGSTPTPCSCSHDSTPTNVRTLPVEYPPVVSRPDGIFSIAVPTSTSSPS